MLSLFRKHFGQLPKVEVFGHHLFHRVQHSVLDFFQVYLFGWPGSLEQLLELFDHYAVDLRRSLLI